ncbi:MAG: DNA polymerase I [Clostridia bacterium]|nr:DNA polymerase I [Clostridia bacterium]
MKKLLIVDGNSILNRAYYGIRPLTTKDGLFTNAVYGVANILKKHLDALSPDYAVVAFDLKAPTFRHKKYELYKANRHPMPDELRMQLPYIRECVADLGFHIVELEGYEADDVIGTVARMGDESEEISSYILTGDRDSLQLLSDRTTVILAKTKEDVYCTPETFLEEYGVPSDHYVDVKALMGDTSDNIPGVAGIGEKTAFRLIADYNSLDTIYDGLTDAPLTASVKRKLEDGKESAYLSQYLARIERYVPLNATVADFIYDGIRKEKLKALFEKLEFHALITKFSLNDIPSSHKKEATTRVWNAPEVKGADALLSIARDIPVAVSFAVENTVLLCGKDFSYCIEGLDEETIGSFLVSHTCIYHDYKAVHSRFLSRGLDIPCYFDTLLGAYVLDSTQGNAPKERILSRYCGDYQENAEYDAQMIHSAYETISRELKEVGSYSLLTDIEIPLAAVLSRMEKAGCKVDINGIRAYAEVLRQTAEDLKARIYFAAGTEFNINSPQQLGHILFEVLSFPHGKKTKTGYSTSADILEKLRPYGEIIGDILDYRKVSKLISTYCEGIEKVVDENSRVHTSFNQTITATGRLSSTDPNLQNIPVRDEIGRELRKFFTAENSDRVLIDADYSQIELRLLAHLSHDAAMIRAFQSGEDFHSQTASQVFGVPPEAVTPELRKRAKAVNFGIVYGIGAYSLSQDLGITTKEAAAYISGYLNTYKDVDGYLKGAIEGAKAVGYTTTMFSRRRYIPELAASNKMTQAFGERVAMNSPIQGSAADIIKIAMIRVDRALKEAGVDAHLILQVHDELVLESARECAERAAEILKYEMENAADCAVPLTVEVAIGDNWYSAK